MGGKVKGKNKVRYAVFPEVHPNIQLQRNKPRVKDSVFIIEFQRTITNKKGNTDGGDRSCVWLIYSV